MELIGLLAVVWRVPSYQTSSRCMPFSRNLPSMRWPYGPLTTAFRWSKLEMTYGAPISLSSGMM